MWRLKAAVALALIGMVCGSAQARVEFSAGRSNTPRHGWTNVGFFEWIGDPQPVGWKLAWAPAFSLGRLNGRDTNAERLNHAAWVAAGGARLYGWRSLFWGFQVAATHGKTDALSSTYEFVSSLGWQENHWQVMVRHISNGDLHRPNHGETMLLVGVAF
ncbi:MAG: lipid A 3-O-deacylase [Rhodanobacteraceae bacterium]|nr:MAG: lipid A 3-O-deacylase [Rhodanobacteraceae bacterium]